MLGHEEQNSRKKNKVRQEWRVLLEEEVEIRENIRGLNSSNKQEDIRGFLNKQKVGLVASLETKVKLKNIIEVGDRMFGGWNYTTLRQALWQDLKLIASNMQEAWCVKGDFNAVLHPDERIGGEEVPHMEINDFTRCLEDSELVEVSTAGADKCLMHASF
ncbi:hypothetical protein Cgig2_011334 [Carnegiea gigantea]|uniref:Reverse transcriptase n=1 Tax=Carnegiea gigantea TaxID=171969 RepID=A0A9Q1JTF9_9CARY|nr:hypothetical protein Cgig2_011334 [Carnegiea gigantea]